ncbi:response regulator [Candidatus Enterovibrio escicola]
MVIVIMSGMAIIMANMRSAAISRDIIEISEQRFEQHKLAIELKQSFNLLTQFMSTYTVTSDKKWLYLYDKVKGINEGQLPPPKGYRFDYWTQLADPISGNIRKITIPVKPDYPSIMSRMRNAGASESHLDLLKQALVHSQPLASIENDAIDLMQGKRRTAGGFVKIVPDPEKATKILFGANYIHEKNKVMGPISAFYDAVIRTSDTELNRLHQQKLYMHSITLSMAILLIVSVLITTVLFWLRFLKPLDNIRNNIICKVRNKEFEFKLDVESQGELKDLAVVQNVVLQEISERFEFNRQIKVFSDLIRGCIDIKDLGDQVVNFFSQCLELPYAAIYVSSNETLRLVGRVGVDDKSEEMATENASFHRTIMRSKTFLRIRNHDDKFSITLPAGILKLEEMYFFPLNVNNDVVGVLELGSVRCLSDKEINWLAEVQADLAVGIQLTMNAELQLEADHRISEQLKLNKQIINAIPNPMYFRDTTGTYIGVNDAFTNFLGLFYIDVIDRSPSDLFKDDVASMFHEKEKLLFDKPSSHVYDIELANAEGNIRILTVYEAIYYGGDGKAMGIVGLFVDVTTQKRLELDLIAAKDQATQASKSKGEFLANMSHEIRTPMNAILGLSNLVLLTRLTKKQRIYVGNIEKAGKNLLSIINDILDFSKIEAGKVAIEHIEFRFSEVLDNISNIISVKAKEKDLELIFDIDPDLPDDLIGDPLRLGQIIINLASNSVKFTERGEVIIRVRKLTDTNDMIEIKFDIQDSGIGMSDEQVARLFKSFSQADGSITRKYGGTGLGLTISKNFVELMGGHIWIESDFGKGSTFSFIIRCGRSDSGIKKQLAKSTILNDKRVLVVDDNQDSRDIMYALLDKLDLRVSVVPNGEEAVFKVESADKSNDGFDVVLMDWKMPGINGDEATVRIQKLSLDKIPKVILASAYGEDTGLISEDIQRIFDAYLIKPINPSSLFDALMEAFGKEELKLLHKWTTEKPDTQEIDLTGVKILLVEDNLINQEVAKGILEQFNPTIHVADNGQIALDMIKKQPFDMVLMDMQMPVMDGVTATKKIREIKELAELPIVAMTANAMERDVNQCREAGMNGHVSKPIDISELLASIKRWTAVAKNDITSSILANGKKSIVPKIPNLIDIDPFILDTNEGIRRIGGNATSYWKIMTTFTESKLGKIDEIREAITNEDRNDIEMFAHSLKCAAANVSARDLVLIAEKLEDQAVSGLRMDFGLIEEIKDRLEEINHYVVQKKYEENSERVSFSGYTFKEFRIELEQLKILLNNFDTQAVDFIEGIKKSSKNMDIDLTSVEHAICNSEYEVAVQKLETVLESFSVDKGENTPTFF